MSAPIQLRIEKAVYGGAGLARLAAQEPEIAGKVAARTDQPPRTEIRPRKAVFVPFALPGELVEAKIEDDKGSFANASLTNILERSEERAAPRCPHFGVCGGCHYQHATYAAQLGMKAAILREALERARLRDLPPIQVLSSEAQKDGPWHYRNRIRLHVISERRDLALGYRKSGSHELVNIVDPSSAPSCPIATPLLLRVAKALADAATESQVIFALLGACSQVELFCDAEQSELQISLYLRAAAADGGSGHAAPFRETCDLLQAVAPQIVGGGLYSPANDSAPNTAFKQVASWGAGALRYSAAGFAYRVGRGAFFQVNRSLADALVALVADGRGGRLAWDLYAGVGLFSRALSGSFAHVVAVESASPANKDLAFNLLGASATALPATALDFLREQVGATLQSKRTGHQARFKGAAKQVARATPDLIVVDPPRAGLGADVCGLLGRVAAAELVYVSCDPATLSRDLAALIESGYQLRQLHMVDMFPQTFHLESVAVLKKS